ncbi:uncharacterized protein LOC132891510 isoform X1 [Neoarius graeffei]|uniref:uncharacterized protein LOC132871511 isoform X2 n=1 Tax=Neoarius graeffei TaxID=443677 RepID=UPI00298CC64F|nr:uncharacterized protein LOC132871511 isoform X2 [Neoarius graeffei]XP_060784910.1 uncharacterized protein LOC132891420 isoform X2 [Neoarius graeffei]XP_060785151.1 uncharacterized protein LOC132891510 isoform X1 [Neoarius graeffei]
MTWICKLCAAAFNTKSDLLTHYRLQHSHYSRISPLPCLYSDCICTCQTFPALKAHLSRCHPEQPVSHSLHSQGPVIFKCPLCTFQQPLSQSAVFSHLRRHLKNHETVQCPYKDCSYATNVYSSFNTHQSREHQADLVADFQTEIASEDPCNLASASEETSEECPGPSRELENADHVETVSLRNQLKKYVSSLFLKMQAILHISDTATQEIVDHLNEVFSLSEPLIKEAVHDVLTKNGHCISESALSEVVAAIMDCNVLSTSTCKGAELSSSKRRKTFIEHNYPCVMPVEYQLEPGHASMYVPILSMIQELFRSTDILKKISETDTAFNQYVSCANGSYFMENELLSTGDLVLPLQLYIDDLELCNPLGTSRKIHKVCAVYWVLANLPPKYRSTLHAIQLAILVKVTDLRKYGYAAVLAPLLRDVHTLEVDGVFIEGLGQNVKGTVFCVSADNLAAHGLGGFVESFRSGCVCRFCLGSVEQYQESEVRDEKFAPRTKTSHDLHVQTVKSNLNDIIPLPAYRVDGALILTPKRFILVKQQS